MPYFLLNKKNAGISVGVNLLFADYFI